jgi:hypothetical protein
VGSLSYKIASNTDTLSIVFLPDVELGKSDVEPIMYPLFWSGIVIA